MPGLDLCVMILFILHYVTSQELLESHQAVLSILKSENYSTNLLPPLSTDGTNLTGIPEPMKVYVNLGLRDIESIDDRKMELKTQLSLRQRWVDSRLKYPSINQNGYVTLSVDIGHKPWTPDIFVQNEKSSVVHSITKPDSFYRIYPNGTIFSSTRISLTVACFMDLRRFPFDKQICDIALASYAYTKSSLIFLWEHDAIDEMDAKIGSNHLKQFKLEGQTFGQCKMKSSAGEFSAVYVAMAFKRQLAFYSIQLYMPCSMLVVISWVSFWLGNAMEARLSLTVTVLLTLSTQIAGTNQALAEVSYVTGFSIFSGACLSITVLSILEAASVFYWQAKNRRRVFKVGLDVMNTKVGFDVEKGHVDKVYQDSGTGMDPLAEKIDKISMIVFPLSFALFMVVYFVTYLWEFNELGEEFSDMFNSSRTKDINLPCKYSRKVGVF